MNSITVLIAEDDDAVRDALLVLLRSEGIRARAFASGAELLANLPETEAACIITDVRMPDMDGTEVVRRLAEMKGSSWPVIVITGHADVPLAVQMMKAGVVDFIEKPFDPNRLLEAVRGCLGHLSESRRERLTRIEIQERIALLSLREHQVFRALIEGRSNKEIAADLAISPRTVEIFRAKVMSKMQAGSLSALVRMGLLAPSA